MGDFAPVIFDERFEMNTKMSKLALAIGALVMAGGAMAQSTATAMGTANATIINPITVAESATLEFGNVVAGAGTVIIATTNIRTDSTSALTPGAQMGAYRAAGFNVTGEGDFTYDITLPANGTVTLSDGATHTMSVNDFTVASSGTGTVSGTPGAFTGQLAAGGTGNLNVGATLVVSAGQVSGTYTGTYLVTVAYN